MGWEDSLVQGLTSGDFLSGAFQALAGTAAGLLGASSQEDALKAQEQAAEDQQKLELKLAALNARYGGGGGGGGGGSSSALTTAQRLAAIQNQTDTKMSAIQSLMNGLQTGILSGGR